MKTPLFQRHRSFRHSIWKLFLPESPYYIQDTPVTVQGKHKCVKGTISYSNPTGLFNCKCLMDVSSYSSISAYMFPWQLDPSVWHSSLIHRLLGTRTQHTLPSQKAPLDSTSIDHTKITLIRNRLLVQALTYEIYWLIMLTVHKLQRGAQSFASFYLQ